jgi:hypothetical protein
VGESRTSSTAKEILVQPTASRPYRTFDRILGRAAAWGALALLVTFPVGAAAPPASLQGTWELNPDLTAQLRKDEAKSSRGAGRQGGGGGGFGRHGGGGRGGGGFGGGGGRGYGSRGDRSGDDSAGGSGGKSGNGENGQEETGGGLARLTIVQQGAQVTITNPQGKARALKVDGSKVRDESGPGGPAQVQAKWDDDGSLLVDVKPDKGSHRTESYVVSNDHKHLYVTTTVSRRLQGDAKMVRAYDLVPETAPETPAPDAASSTAAAPPASGSASPGPTPPPAGAPGAAAPPPPPPA